MMKLFCLLEPEPISNASGFLVLARSEQDIFELKELINLKEKRTSSLREVDTVVLVLHSISITDGDDAAALDELYKKLDEGDHLLL